MKKLSQIELFLDGSYDKEKNVAFMLCSRCICGYLERQLADLEYETTFSRINIKCTKNIEETGNKPLKGTSYLEVVILYDLENFFNASNNNEKQKIYTDIILSGLNAASDRMSTPLGFCRESLKVFEASGFVNEWIHLEKSWKKQKIKTVFKCSLTPEAFYQNQEVYLDDEMIQNKVISTIKPREFLFFQVLGKATLNNNEIIYSKGSKRISTYDLNKNQFTFLRD